MDLEFIQRRYQEMQAYLLWTEEDAGQVRALHDFFVPHLGFLVEDFYEEIERHPEARKVITGGEEQIQRLKGTLQGWILGLFSGKYDGEYVVRRWRVGWRHVEIGLDQFFANSAVARLRYRMIDLLHQAWPGDTGSCHRACTALNKLLDLDLTIIEIAYHTVYGERLQQTERLAAIGQIAGGVAHELRNPLNVIKTSIYFLLNAKNTTPEKRVEHLQRIEKQVNLADSVITALSNFARMPVPSMQSFSLAALVKDLLDLTLVPEKVQVSIQIPAELPSPLGDKDQIGIAISNLIRNAIEAMPAGGTLTLLGRAGEERVELQVRDTGVGISRENLARVMEPLFSTKARGLGLGLALARSILEKNQGTLHVESIPDQGSTFTVRLRSNREMGRE